MTYCFCTNNYNLKKNNDDDDDKFRSWSHDKERPVYAESDTEVEYSRRLNVRSISPSVTRSSEVVQGRSRTLQRPPAAAAIISTPVAAAAAGRHGDDAELRRQYHRRQTSLPHTPTSGLFTPPFG